MKKLLTCFAILMVFFLQFCTPSRQARSSADTRSSEARVTYQNDISPIMKMRCSPCHFPDRGKVKFLDTYGSARDNYDEMMNRVGLPTDAEGFMPYQSKREPLSDSLKNVFVLWKNQGFPK